jgi:predicted nucleic acid-binding protein
MTVSLDADCIIYFVEQHPAWGAKITPRISALRAAGHNIAFSDLARTECLAGPLASVDIKPIADYEAFFADPDVSALALTPIVCERAARIRAVSNFALKTPDCLHLAAAVEHGCGLFLTHDHQLTQCNDISVEVLS